MHREVLIIFAAVALYYLTRPRPPLRYDIVDDTTSANNAYGNDNIMLPVYYSHVGYATSPKTTKQHFDMLKKVFMMNVADYGGVHFPPPPKYTQYLVHPVVQTLLRKVFYAFRKYMSQTPLTFLSRDPREHHQLALSHNRPDTVEFNELNYYAFRVDSLTTLQRMAGMLKVESAVKSMRGVNECDMWALYIKDNNNDTIKVYVESGHHVQDFVQMPLDLDSKDVKENTSLICSSLPGFQSKENWLLSLKQSHPELERMDRPGKFWSASHSNDPWNRNISFSHISVKAHNIDGMVSFYSRVMGLFPVKQGYLGNNRVVRMMGRDYRLFEFVDGRSASALDLEFPVTHQFAFRMESLEDLREFRDILLHEPIHSLAFVTHGNCWSIYFCDPENNRIEVFVDGPNHVKQPVIEDYNLDLSDEELTQHEVLSWQHHSSFQSVKEYRMKNARKWGLTEKK
ncbi:uncharacterized protein [Ptychodera flava]|uniref:uncharacterized protein n=1 Tax=Ptychodera flava TaxID=63121 RepID=UPI00396A386B